MTICKFDVYLIYIYMLLAAMIQYCYSRLILPSYNCLWNLELVVLLQILQTLLNRFVATETWRGDSLELHNRVSPGKQGTKKYKRPDIQIYTLLLFLVTDQSISQPTYCGPHFGQFIFLYKRILISVDYAGKILTYLKIYYNRNAIVSITSKIFVFV